MSDLGSVAERLSTVPGLAPRLVGDASVELGTVSHDSRRVGPGALFCCVPGAVFDGHDFAPAALAAGAAALLVERQLDVDRPQLVVSDVRAAMGPASAVVYGDPSQHLTVVGVTGTNGKTTSVELFAVVLGRVAAVDTLGTLTGARTTPEAPELQARLAQGVDRRLRYVAMEVSSHALDMHRVAGTRFRAAVFTNLGRDHLDHHHDLESYFLAKARLFRSDLTDVAVINTDDPAGRRLASMVAESGDVELRTFGLADASGLTIDGPRSRFSWRDRPVELHLAGTHNVMNALGVATAAEALGLDPDDIAAGLCAAQAPRGRFEFVDVGQPFTVAVDYAHTPDALEAALTAAREIIGPGARVTVVFGCGGDRDRAKRPDMGRAAALGADRVIVTSDNPRSEAPAAIIGAILDGVPAERAAVTTVIEERDEAIRTAVSEAAAGDVILIAGKGHETTQVIGDRTIAFDDRLVAVGAISHRSEPNGPGPGRSAPEPSGSADPGGCVG